MRSLLLVMIFLTTMSDGFVQSYKSPCAIYAVVVDSIASIKYENKLRALVQIEKSLMEDTSMYHFIHQELTGKKELKLFKKGGYISNNEIFDCERLIFNGGEKVNVIEEKNIPVLTLSKVFLFDKMKVAYLYVFAKKVYNRPGRFIFKCVFLNNVWKVQQMKFFDTM